MELKYIVALGFSNRVKTLSEEDFFSLSNCCISLHFHSIAPTPIKSIGLKVVMSVCPVSCCLCIFLLNVKLLSLQKVLGQNDPLQNDSLKKSNEMQTV